MDPTFLEAVAGMSKRKIQWVASMGIQCEIMIAAADGRARES